MSSLVYFTPGPAHLYPTVSHHIQQALKDDICSISHRSKAFHQLFAHTREQLRELMSIPADFDIYFTGSATEIWERFLESCVEKHSHHLVNGSFSKKFHEFAVQMNKTGSKHEKSFGEGFWAKDIDVPAGAEAVCVTSNETSSGVYFPEKEIEALKKQNPEVLMAIDAVSSVPYPQFDYAAADTVLFSVQKAFGLPAGLGVWIANKKCLEKAERLVKNPNSGTYHNLVSLHKNGVKDETPSTPNVLGIYLLGKVAEDMNTMGIERVRKNISENAAKAYALLESAPNYSPAVTEVYHRSPTVIVANTTEPAAEVIAKMKAKGFVPGSGYGSYKEKQIRIANFPATPPEVFEQMLNTLKTI